MKIQEFPFKNIDEARKFMIQIRKTLSKEFTKLMSYNIQRQVIRTEEFERSKNIACFVGTNGEPDTSLILNQNEKKIFLPKVVSEDRIEFFLYTGRLKEGKYRIPEPVSEIKVGIDKIDLFLVPGLLFDTRGFRIGYGKGYYDRILVERRPDAQIFALSWSFQVFEKIPYEKANDIFVQKIFTEIYSIDISTNSIQFYPPERIS